MLYPGEFTMVRHTTKKIVAGIASCLAIIVPNAIIPAVSLAAYIPPTDQVSPKTRATAAGRRTGCEVSNKFQNTSSAYIAALAPESYIGKTASTHPTFAWYVFEGVSVPAQFKLYEHDPATKSLKPQPVFAKTVDSTPGVMKLALPQEEPGLATGKTYAWQVVLLCNAASPSQNPWVRRPVQVTGVSPALGQRIASTEDPVQKVNIYAQAGLWYDALNMSLSVSADPRLTQSMVSLLDNLANLEQQKEPKEAPSERQFSYALREVVALNQTR
jgi:hypothetical protein